jgi:Type IV secretion system pilin
MFNTSTIKSILKTLAVAAILSAIAVIALPNITAFAQVGDITPNNLCPAGGCPLIGNSSGLGKTLANRNAVSNLILQFASFFIYLASAISVLFIVWGGYNYINATDPKGNENGKKILINALIGLAVCILSLTIVSFIGGTLEGNLVGSIVGNK